jgi:hypothetical protein
MSPWGILFALPRSIPSEAAYVPYPFCPYRSGGVTFRSDDVIALLSHQYFRLLAGSEGESVVREIIKGNMIRVPEAMLTTRFRMKELFFVPADGSAIPQHLASVMGQLEDATFTAEEEGIKLSTDREYLRAAMNSTTRLANLIRSYNRA